MKQPVKNQAMAKEVIPQSETGFKKNSDVYPNVKLSRKYITSFVDKV